MPWALDKDLMQARRAVLLVLQGVLSILVVAPIERLHSVGAGAWLPNFSHRSKSWPPIKGAG
jgi:hypothetical protein